MELIRISNRKLKLMLTPTDMSHFELNTDTLGEDSAKTHRAFQLLLSELKAKIGFVADDHHLSVQYFPSREGGCEMFISNLPENENTGGDSNTMKTPDQNALQLRASKKPGDCFWRDFAYRFEALDDLLAVCARLHFIGYICESAAYRDEQKRYFLFLSALAASPFSIPDELGFIVEYGSIENAPALKLYVREHGTPICTNGAIGELAKLC